MIWHSRRLREAWEKKRESKRGFSGSETIIPSSPSPSLSAGSSSGSLRRGGHSPFTPRSADISSGFGGPPTNLVCIARIAALDLAFVAPPTTQGKAHASPPLKFSPFNPNRSFISRRKSVGADTGLQQFAPAVSNIAKPLWEQAVDKLSVEDRNAFNFNDPDKRNTLLDVIEAVKVKRDQCIDKQWKFRKSNGEEVVLRCVVDNLLVRLDRYSDIGNTAIQHSPGGGVALAWAGYRFLLKIALNDTATWASILTALEYITHALSRCAIYEFLYIKTSSKLESAQHLASSLPDLYSSILKYLCASKRFFGSNTALRIASGVVNPYSVTFEPLIGEIISQEARVEKDARVASEEFQRSGILRAEKESSDQKKRTEKLQRILEEMQLPLSKIQLDITEICELVQQGFEGQETRAEAMKRVAEEALKKEERLKALMWLSKIASEDHHTFVCSNRLANTGEWLLQKSEFVKWRDSKVSAVLWLHGIAGAGKTKLISLVIDKFRDTKGEGDALAYFYCNYKESERRDPECILRSIAKQLSTIGPGSALSESLVEFYQKRKKDGFQKGDLQLEESKNLILELAGSYKQTVIAIDALDECEKGTRHKLLHVLQSILNESKGRVKVFVTSRDDDDIVLHFDGLPNIDINSGDNSTDIENYVITEVSRCIRKKKILRGIVPPDLKDLIILTLIKDAHGMFLWVHLQILSICKEKSISAIKKALKKLPSGLRGAFSEILSRIEDQTCDSSVLARKALSFIMCAQRPLSPHELIAALRIKPPKMEWTVDDGLTKMAILDVCQNLVVIDTTETVHVLRFAHLSVQDFLKEKFDLSEGHAQMAEICLSFLSWPNHASYTNYEFVRERAEQHALADYSARNWAAHVRLSGTMVGETLMDLQKGFLSLRPNPAYITWCSNLEHGRGEFPGLYPLEHHSTPVAPLLVACYFGLLGICKYLLSIEQRGRINCEDIHGRTPISMAAGNGYEELVEMLLQTQGVDVNSKDRFGTTPLLWAAMNGYTKTVRQLLKKEGVEVNCKNTMGKTPLLIAAEKGCETLVEVLLGTDGVDANSGDSRGETPLCWAAKEGHIKVAGLLLRKREVDSNHKNNHDRTPLSMAAENGHGALVEALLQIEGVDVNSKDCFGATPLWWAARGGHIEVVKQLLLSEVIDCNYRNNEGRAPLSIAAENGHRALVELLLRESRVDMNTKDCFGMTPLWWAAREGHLSIMKQLLKRKDVDVNFEDRGGRTLLSIAAENGYGVLVEALLRVDGVDVHTRDCFGTTPLLWAARGGRTKVVKQLLQRGAGDVNCKDKMGRTPLSIASERGHTALIDVLLQEEAVDVNCRDIYGSTPLLRAARNGYTKAVRRLIQAKGVEIDCRNESGQTPLSEAVERGHRGVIEELQSMERGLAGQCLQNGMEIPTFNFELQD